MSRRDPVRINYRDLEKMVPIDKIIIEVVPHLTQRYDTCGDWFRTVQFRQESAACDEGVHEACIAVATMRAGYR